MSGTKSQSQRKRVLSGMRPTGRLHIGHYFGALLNWLKMQNARLEDGSPEFDSFHFVADWHALTTHYADSSQVAANTLEVATDWLAVGLDPEKVTLFIQSAVPEHAELHLLLSMITPLSWLERVPTYKEQIENLRDKDLGTYGFLGYPLLQSADIVMYGEPGQALYVPVGEDQAPHIEMTREVVRKFNFHAGLRVDTEGMRAALRDSTGAGEVSLIADALDRMEGHEGNRGGGHFPSSIDVSALEARIRRIAESDGINNLEERFRKQISEHEAFKKYVHTVQVLEEPDVILTETPRVPGTDGRRMAKSYGNAIWLSDTPDEIRAKARNMMTDPQRVRRTDPGRPEVCPVFAYHNLFPEEKSADDCARIERVDFNCRNAKWGCLDCKAEMADALIKWIAPIQERRAKYAAKPKLVWDILEDGSRRAKKVAEQTMSRVRQAIFNWQSAGREAAPSSNKGVAADSNTD